MQALLFGLRAKRSVRHRLSTFSLFLRVSRNRCLSASHERQRKPEEPGPEDCCQVRTAAFLCYMDHLLHVSTKKAYHHHMMVDSVDWTGEIGHSDFSGAGRMHQVRVGDVPRGFASMGVHAGALHYLGITSRYRFVMDVSGFLWLHGYKNVACSGKEEL